MDYYPQDSSLQFMEYARRKSSVVTSVEIDHPRLRFSILNFSLWYWSFPALIISACALNEENLNNDKRMELQVSIASLVFISFAVICYAFMKIYGISNHIQTVRVFIGVMYIIGGALHLIFIIILMNNRCVYNSVLKKDYNNIYCRLGCISTQMIGVFYPLCMSLDIIWLVCTNIRMRLFLYTTFICVCTGMWTVVYWYFDNDYAFIPSTNIVQLLNSNNFQITAKIGLVTISGVSACIALMMLPGVFALVQNAKQSTNITMFFGILLFIGISLGFNGLVVDIFAFGSMKGMFIVINALVCADLFYFS